MEKIRKRLALLLLVFIFAGGSAVAQDATVVISGLPNYAPVMWTEDDSLKGIASELTQRIFSELEVDCAFKVLPWKRVQQEAAAGSIDLVAGIYKNAEREQYLDYSESFMTDPGVLFVKAGKGFGFHQRADLIGKTGVTNQGYSWGESMDRFISEKLDMVYLETPEQAFRMLTRRDRNVDYYLYGLIPGLIVLKQLGMEDEIEYLPEPVTEERFYFGFSKRSSHRTLLPRINELIRKLKDEGYVDQLTAKYIEYCSKRLPH